MSISAYWWSPRRQPKVLAHELLHNRHAWVSMHKSGGRFFSNFGDELSQAVIRLATGRTVTWRQAAKADVIGIGSILERYFRSGGDGWVWGSGLRSGVDFPVDIDRSRFLAVRGQLTRDALDLPSAIPLGDPGLLARELFPPASARQGTMVLPHFSVFGTDKGRRQLADLRGAGMTICRPNESYEQVCTNIAQAEHVITSSLHGIIVSHSLRTPVSFVELGPSQETDFKYCDYMSVYDRSPKLYAFADALIADAQCAMYEHGLGEVDDIDRQIDDLNNGLLAAAGRLR